MNQYVCLSCEPWQAVPTRTQQLMARLKGADVLFFGPSQHPKDHKGPGRKMRPGLTAYSLPPVLEVDEKYGFLFRAGQRRLVRSITRAMERHRFRDVVLWATSPAQVHLLDELPHRGLVYDCDRDWPQYPPEWESELALAADVVFAASPGLIHHLSPCNDNIALLPEGVNYSMFSRDKLDTPPELKGLKAPLLGYTGTVWQDLDLSPVLQAARDLPRCAFAFVGRVEEGNPFLPALRALPNVAFLGQVPLLDLPDYLGRFNVCLNLLRRRGGGSDILPGRIYEYLSTGKPIVTMLYPDQIEHFPDVVYGAHTNPEFSRLCADALAEAGDWARKRRRDYGAAASWGARVDEVCRILGAIGLY